MSDTPRVVVYGASGYTGKLIAWKLAELGIPFIAAGRSQERLEEQMKLVPELEGAAYECRAVEHSVEALGELFKDADIVYNVTGPFMQIGHEVVEAALNAGCHYLDTTGEQDWMFLLKREWGQKFEDAGLLLCPACSWMWVGGLLAAEIALETPGVDSLDMVYIADSGTSVASTKSFLRMCTKPQYFIEHNELVMWPYATAYDIYIPGQSRTTKSLPWGGGGETVWFEDDDRVRNSTTLIAFKNPEMFGAILQVLVDFEEKHRHLSAEEQEEVTNQIGGAIVTEEPGREDPDLNRSIVVCHGRGNTVSRSVVLRGNSPYIQTGRLAAITVQRILSGKMRAVGFASPAEAFGTRELISCLAEEGLLAWEATSV
jgi:hypothetical protein